MRTKRWKCDRRVLAASALVWLPALLFAGKETPPPAETNASFLYQPAYAIDKYVRLPAMPYHPKPGDLFFAVTESRIMRFGHHLSGAADPHHSGIVFARPDGSLAILEAGPFNATYVSGWNALDHLVAYEKTERVYLRRRKCPLTPEQSARLTSFAMLQVGKKFATWRVLGQLTPFRSRGPLRTEFCGKVRGDRERWFCAELLVECLVATGLQNAETARPAATYPRDLFFDSSPNPWLNEHLDLSADWHPPAQWTSVPYGSSPIPPRRIHRLWWNE
ncbi:MAG: hypothetical protein U0840_03345 [Gemmataceae bacterium]